MSKTNAFLGWLPTVPDWNAKLRQFTEAVNPTISDAIELASGRLDFLKENNLAEVVRRRWQSQPPGMQTKPVRLAILASSTVDHLAPAIFIAALRHRIWVDVYITDYGQYFQDLMDPSSGLHAFAPTAILYVFDAAHVTGCVHAAMTSVQSQDAFVAAKERIASCWRAAKERFGCAVIQQTLLPTQPCLIGANEHRLPGSRAAMTAKLNAWMREAVDEFGVDLLAVDAQVASDGLQVWYDQALWLRSKQEVKPTAAPMYGELVARWLVAQQGLSRKCLVLDLDNTLWGGVIGDDGLEGIVLGQGSALGEAYAAVQSFAKELSRRGVIIAVCSKNDEKNAVEAFEKHPEMVLRRSDIACFVANWDDKANNIRRIASELNIGIDSLVFLDDNPFERALVRKELPMVAVPEVGDDPAHYPQMLSNAGYFDVTAVTAEDLVRTQAYRENRAREELKRSSTDMQAYLEGLDMSLIWRRFDKVALKRVTQLINKTNQFNLTTRRYTEDEVEAMIDNPIACGFQIRLTDCFGDNGIIAVVILRLDEKTTAYVDTWLMSCRVLGRQVEAATLNFLIDQARIMGAERLVGEYKPTAKNAMVKDHYEVLGFTTVAGASDEMKHAVLDLADHVLHSTFIKVIEDSHAV